MKYTYVITALAFSAAVFSCSTTSKPRIPANALKEPISWVELGPDSAVIARAITSGADCPRIHINDEPAAPMTERASPDEAFPVRTCEAMIPRGTRSAHLSERGWEQDLPLPPAQPKRILIMGDTGCRIKVGKEGEPTHAQGCNDAKAWPFPTMVKNEATLEPDLIVHLGDYHYREAACPPENAYCAGSPYGNNWDVWNADFFAPARPLLRKAPWIFVRGNHEACARAGEGWFRFLEPRPATGTCADETAPYHVKIGEADFVVMDTTSAQDKQAPPEVVEHFRKQLESIGTLPLNHAWLLSHKPFWALIVKDLRNRKSPIDSFNKTLMAAAKGKLPAGIDLIFAGHLHEFSEFHFADRRATQFVVGNGGSARNPPAVSDPKGIEIDGTRITSGASMDDYGFFVLESTPTRRWLGYVHDGEGRRRLSCSGTGRDLHCR